MADLAEAVGFEDFVGGLLDAVPAGGVWRENVASAADGLELAFIASSLCADFEFRRMTIEVFYSTGQGTVSANDGRNSGC